MPKGDITLPNASGKVDPRILSWRTSGSDRKRPDAQRSVASKKSPARRIYEGVRSLMRSR